MLERLGKKKLCHCMCKLKQASYDIDICAARKRPMHHICGGANAPTGLMPRDQQQARMRALPNGVLTKPAFMKTLAHHWASVPNSPCASRPSRRRKRRCTRARNFPSTAGNTDASRLRFRHGVAHACHRLGYLKYRRDARAQLPGLMRRVLRRTACPKTAHGKIRRSRCGRAAPLSPRRVRGLRRKDALQRSPRLVSSGPGGCGQVGPMCAGVRVSVRVRARGCACVRACGCVCG